jgi:DNA polymerase-3 subunit epsilon
MKQLSFESSGDILSSTPFVVIDCETTGVNPFTDAITEIAAITICEGAQTGSFHALINPEQELTRRIIELTSITNEELIGCPTINQILPSLLEFIGDKIIVGHNIKFDISFINNALKRNSYQSLNNKYIDTLTIAKKIYMNEVANFKLGTLTKHIKSKNQPTHRAYSDVLATIDLFHDLIEKSSALGVKGVNDFLAIPSKRSRSRFSKRSLAEKAPNKPGIYFFTSIQGDILYIGKSRNIKERLRSYFISDDRQKIGQLIYNTDKIEYITTPSAYEARILELRSLQLYKPQYNTADISESKFVYLTIDVTEKIPTIRLTKYKSKLLPEFILGPFTSKTIANNFRDTLNFLFGLRHCENKLIDSNKRPLVPCINSLQNIHSCFCMGDTSGLNDYLTRVKKLTSELTTDYHLYTNTLIVHMQKYSNDLLFERAKQFFDYSVLFEKWMYRFSLICKTSKMNIKNSINVCDVYNGMANVRMDPIQVSALTNKILNDISEINSEIINSPKSDDSSLGFKFICKPNEFKERLILASHLERLNLVTK